MINIAEKFRLTDSLLRESLGRLQALDMCCISVREMRETNDDTSLVTYLVFRWRTRVLMFIFPRSLSYVVCNATLLCDDKELWRFPT
jgi:hypothetical protein